MRSHAFALVAVASVPVALAAFGAAISTIGCEPSKPAANPQTDAAAPASEAAVTTAPLPDAVVPVPDAQAAGDAVDDGDIWGPVLAVSDAIADVAADAPPPACWQGFVPTGNAEADLIALGQRCAQGMTQLVPPVKHGFKAGEAKSVPVPIPPGCYRVIAVGGTGVKDVDLALKDNAGKIVAADMTPDDVFPMIHPNKEFCTQSLQILNLTISVKKGSGEVAGGVWKR